MLTKYRKSATAFRGNKGSLGCSAEHLSLQYLKKPKDTLFFVFRYQHAMRFTLKLNVLQTWWAQEVFCKWQQTGILGFHLMVAYEEDVNQNLQTHRSPNCFIMILYMSYHFQKLEYFTSERFKVFLQKKLLWQQEAWWLGTGPSGSNHL